MLRSRAAVAALSVVVVLGACTGDPESEPLPEPVDVETCDGLVPVGVVYVERMVLALDGLGVEVLTGDASPPDDVAALIQLGEDLDERASRLSWDVRVLNDAILERTGELDAADDPVIALFLELVRGGVIGSLPDSPAPTTTASPTDG